MKKQHFLAGVGRALLIKGTDLIGVARTLTESSFNFSIASEEIRGGMGNPLWGKYFHDSNLQVTLTDAMFDIRYIALSLGVDVQSGGISIKEEQLTVAKNKVTASETPIAVAGGNLIGWYKTPEGSDWIVGNFVGKEMTVSGVEDGNPICVKYFYVNENAESVTINTQYIPAELHVVIINDIFSGDVNDISTAERYGRLITDIPRLQMEGSQELTMNSTSAATISLTGNALAVNDSVGCEERPYYGTMTQELHGNVWQDNVIGLAVEGGSMKIPSGGTQAIAVRAVFGGGVASRRINNTDLKFTPTPGTIKVSPEGVVSGTGTGSIKIELKQAGSSMEVVPNLDATVGVTIS